MVACENGMLRFGRDNLLIIIKGDNFGQISLHGLRA